MTYKEWKHYFRTLTDYQRKVLLESYKVLQADPVIYRVCKYDIDIFIYLLTWGTVKVRQG